MDIFSTAGIFLYQKRLIYSKILYMSLILYRQARRRNLHQDVDFATHSMRNYSLIYSIMGKNKSYLNQYNTFFPGLQDIFKILLSLWQRIVLVHSNNAPIMWEIFFNHIANHFFKFCFCHTESVRHDTVKNNVCVRQSLYHSDIVN